MFMSCTEPYLLQTNNFEEALVIEATITNELKTQQIKLSKTYRFEENGPEFVENAVIFIKDNLGNIYNFSEGDEIYESDIPFQAIQGRKYKLFINTADGKSYQSDEELLTNENNIQTVEVADKTFQGERGAEIKVKAYDPTNSSKYYRYEYEETYKIIAPNWLSYTMTVDPVTKELVSHPRTYEARTCYSTVKSNDIILHNTTNLQEDRVDFMVRFLNVTDPKIKNRYSILVKQYVQNLEAYTYYNTLKAITSGSGSILSQNQPGFFSGNIECTTNSNEKVIGFFDVSTVSSQRIFFNFTDVFPNTTEPGYFYECLETCNEENQSICPGAFYFCFGGGFSSPCEGSNVETILNNATKLFYYQTIYNSYPLVFLTELPCGDCTKFSSNIVPPFWQ